MKRNPYPTDNGNALHYFILESQAKTPIIEKLRSLKNITEAFELIENIYYLYAPDGMGRSKLAASESLLSVEATARNWNTANKLVTMLAGL